MRQKRKEKKMISYTTQIPITVKEATTKRFDYYLEWVKSIVSRTTTEDKLSFMETFDFPDLNQLKISLIDSGSYTSKQVDEILAGLSTLPEYGK